jgi:predicted O-linked N-acetylglucosamine transferase (SPINDLY family)
MDAHIAITQAELRFRQRDYLDALGILDGALGRDARDAALHTNRCLVLQRLGRVGEAIDAGRRATSMQPSLPAAHANLGGALRLAHQYDEALAALNAALRLDPSFADAHASLGLVLQQLGQLKEAVDAHRQALTLSPDLPEAWNNIGICLQGLADAAGAMAAYRRALAARPGFTDACSNLLMCAQYDPALTAAQLHDLAGEWQRAWDVENRAPIEPLERADAGGRPLKVGYVSADFYAHPVGWFLRGVLARHDPERVDVHCYASQVVRDAVTEEMIGLVPRWEFVGELTDAALARRIRADRIDVLVDLSGHTAANRLGVFALRSAPVQVSWLGYFASTGVREMDAVLLGRDQVAPGAARYLTEELVSLDCCQFAYAPPEYAPEPAVAPPRDPVFGCFNNLAKLNDEVLEAWHEILVALPSSRLVLKWNSLNDPWLREILQRRFSNHGIDAGRVDLRGPVPHRDMLEEYADIDVGLDPFPFSGALTTCEALWMGVPVVTLEWNRPASRQSASILRAIGLGSLVASDPRGYAERAIALARDAERRTELRPRLREMMRCSPMGDGSAVARELERAYRMLHGRPSGVSVR